VRIEILDHPLDRALDELVALDGVDVVVLDLHEDTPELVHRLIRILVLGRRLRAVGPEHEPAGERTQRGKKNAEQLHGRQPTASFSRAPSLPPAEAREA